MAMSAKFAVMVSYDAIYVYSAELFPTVVRQLVNAKQIFYYKQQVPRSEQRRGISRGDPSFLQSN